MKANIPELKAQEILEAYEGTNNQILFWKHRVTVDGKTLTKAQSEYIVKYHNYPPKVAKKWLKIDRYFGETLQKERELSYVPDQIWVEKLLADSGKAYHVFGGLSNTGRMEFLWIPKCFIVKTNTKVANIDYSKYGHRPPMSHQKIAINTLAVNDKFIIADDMGVGKTTSAVIASIESNAKKILIVCPATLKINWKREIQNYTKHSIYIVDGKNWENGHTYYIINYDIIKNFHEIPKKGSEEEVLRTHLRDANFDLAIIDEAHYLQNNSAKRTQLVMDLVDQIPKLWLLTGTPITSRPINYYNLLKLIDAPIAFNWQTYVKRYCKGFQIKLKTGKRFWKTDGASNLEELHEKTKPYILRRLKHEVLDLPEKIITPVYLELKSREYEELMGEYMEWRSGEGREEPLAIALTKLTNVRMLLAKQKVPHTIELIQRVLDQDKKVIVFTNFTETLDMIADHFGKEAVKLDGRMTKPRRQQSVDQFQEDPKVKVFVSNLKAGGVGITLTAAECVIMNDLSFVPSDHAQAEDRAYRYGQKNNVLVYYPLFENTLEMKIFDILNEKKAIINTVMGDVEFVPEVGQAVVDAIVV